MNGLPTFSCTWNPLAELASGMARHSMSYKGWVRFERLLTCDATLRAARMAPESGGFELDRPQANTSATNGQQAKDPEWGG